MPKGGPGIVSALELGVNSQGEGAARIDHIEDLLGEAAVGAVDSISEVQGLEVHLEVAGDVVARAEVDVGRGVDEGRLGAELGVVLLLAEVIQVLVLDG